MDHTHNSSASAETDTTTTDSEFAFSSLEAVRKKLLDLSGRNQLLNYKHPRAGCVRVIDELPDQIYQRLLEGKTFNFIPVPDPSEKELIAAGYIRVDAKTGPQELKPYPTAEQWAKHRGLDTSFELPERQGVGDDESKHQDQDIQTLLYASELETRLRNLRGKAETAIEETGSNVLYLAMGFLEWSEGKEASTTRLAPLFTLPVRLERTRLDSKQGVYRYSIALKDEGLLTNITLREKLASSFDLVLPEIDDEVTPEAYFAQIQSTILRHQPRWKLRRMVTLAVLNFSKQVMYADLDPENWPVDNRIEDHPIVSRFFSESGTDSSSAVRTYYEEHPIDSIDRVHELFPLIYDADSSQHSALIDAVNGECLVIEGPPGSGKSQTITNLIAACIANGKRVLFVAEKMAALNVVKNRLDTAGLGDFCLELHSHKTQKLRLLEDLKSRLDKQGSYPEPASINADIERFESLKCKLKDYVELINSPWKNTGMTLHAILNKATRYREQLQLDPEPLAIDGVDGDSLNLVRQKELVDHAEMLVDIFNQVQEQAEGGVISNHYWYGVNNTELMGHQVEELHHKLADWSQELEALAALLNDTADEFAFGIDMNLPLPEVQALVEQLYALPELKGGEPLAVLPALADDVAGFELFLIQYEAIHDQLDHLEKVFKRDSLVDTAAPQAVLAQVAKLKELGLRDTNTPGQAYADLKHVQSAERLAREVGARLEQIAPNLPEGLQKACVVSEAGLTELLALLRMIDALPLELWRYRDEVFDSPEMDALLAQLTNRFRTLTPLHTELADHFSMGQLPSQQALSDWRDILANSGIFSFLSSQWRNTRKSLFALANSAKPDKRALLSLLPQLVEYQKQIEEVDELNREEGLLGNVYRGIDTPLDRVAALRRWYKAVRDEYGLGFDTRAVLGNQLLVLDRDLARALSAAGKSGLEEQARELLTAAKQLRERYTRLQPLQNRDRDLAAKDSPLKQLLVGLHGTLKTLLGHVGAPQANLLSIASEADKLAAVQQRSDEWAAGEISKLLVPEFLHLQIAPGQRDESLLAVGRNALAIASAAHSCEAIYNALCKKLTAEQYAALQGAAPKLQVLLDRAVAASESFMELGRVNEQDWLASSEAGIRGLVARNRRAEANPKWLNNWLDYIRLRKKLTNEGVQRILQHLEAGELKTAQLSDVMQLVVSHQLAMEILRKHPSLNEFSGMEQMAIRTKFKEYDIKLKHLQRLKIAYKSAQTDVPTGVASGRVGNYTETALIKLEAGKRMRHIAVRSLLQRAGEAIQALKPCFMMSPMSVAQYLAPGRFDFDVVIMDEASQIRPEDALGAVARGKSLVVVGDPKQLPPTAFFDKVIDAENDEETVALQATESILESAAPMFKTRRLRWHYRSRHESLISFSNLHYYDSDLILFPSPLQESEEFGIRYHRIERGRFVRGKNAEEARAIAKAALQHMSRRAHESVGLVAMNAEQRGEIERHVEELIKEDAVLRAAFERNLTSEEPLFIKNLENVQGDERDVIMISMTYGPDEIGGKTHQRFGPINTDVGWRRLNVLFTRSKKRMHIFSSMTSGDILLSPTSKRGVQSLRAFLEYCETGHLHNTVHTGRPPDSDFEVAVMRALAEHGYECEPQLGVTGYYLDLAVRDPGKPGRFLMGIECDGATYHSAKSTRDRDRLRQEILEGLGWNIRRIWSTDWFKNPQAQLQPILQELEKLRAYQPVLAPTLADIVEPAEIGTVSDAEAVAGETAGRGSEQAAPDFDETVMDEELDEQYPNEPLIAGDELPSDVETSLRARLEAFNERVIMKKFVTTDEQKRLLRPAMIEALIHHLPTSKEEFAEVIPHYLRSGTEPEEGRLFLDQVLELVADYG